MAKFPVRDTSLHKKRTVEGVQLESRGHGVWQVVGEAQGVVFMQHKPVQMGLRGRRYTLHRWTTPPMQQGSRHDAPTYGSLRQAVRVWKEWKEKHDGNEAVEEAVDEAR